MFGLIEIVPIVLVYSVTLSALSAPNQHAVVISERLYLENISNPESRLDEVVIPKIAIPRRITNIGMNRKIETKGILVINAIYPKHPQENLHLKQNHRCHQT